jgi:uncharacterized protein (DUF1697 family)
MLRGINVSGRNKLPMEDLRSLVTDLGGRDVRSYIQSGNVVLGSRRSATALASALERELATTLGTAVPVLVRTAAELAAVLEGNPFLRRPGVDRATLHVTFMAAVPTAAAVATAEAKKAPPDEFVVIGRDVYLRCPQGYGNTKLTNAFFEKTLGSTATTRNWRTVATLVDMAGR